jgi:hypothetical protein
MGFLDNSVKKNFGDFKIPVELKGDVSVNLELYSSSGDVIAVILKEFQCMLNHVPDDVSKAQLIKLFNSIANYIKGSNATADRIICLALASKWIYSAHTNCVFTTINLIAKSRRSRGVGAPLQAMECISYILHALSLIMYYVRVVPPPKVKKSSKTPIE